MALSSSNRTAADDIQMPMCQQHTTLSPHLLLQEAARAKHCSKAVLGMSVPVTEQHPSSHQRLVLSGCDAMTTLCLLACTYLSCCPQREQSGRVVTVVHKYSKGAEIVQRVCLGIALFEILQHQIASAAMADVAQLGSRT
jgi:hypothetical protein